MLRGLWRVFGRILRLDERVVVLVVGVVDSRSFEMSGSVYVLRRTSCQVDLLLVW